MDRRLDLLDRWAQELDGFLRSCDAESGVQRPSSDQALMAAWSRCVQAFTEFSELQEELPEAPLSEPVRERMEQVQRLQAVAQNQLQRLRSRYAEELDSAHAARERLRDLRKAESGRPTRRSGTCDVRG